MNYAKLLEGKRAFITTASQGIGKAIAMLFAEHGAVLAIGGRHAANLETAITELRAISPLSKSYVVDLGVRQEVEDTCDLILRDFGGIDILVNVVGVNKYRGPVHGYDEDTLDLMIETNYKSGLRCMKKFVPGMIERGYGNIVNISSIHGVVTMPNFGIYGGTKGAMNASARAAALDYAPQGIRVNTICPGLIMSDVVQELVDNKPEGREREDFLKRLRAMQPLEPGQSTDIANAALFLASDMSSYITGQAILVDGGASVQAHPL